MAVSITYQPIAPHAKGTLMEIHPHGGKYHQIRAQLGAAGLPIVGDSLYGATKSFQENRIMLHAYSITFIHPVSNTELTYTSQFPGDWD